VGVVAVAARCGDFAGYRLSGNSRLADDDGADSRGDEEQHRGDLQQPFEAGIA
jgi:hypothetical protein